MSIAASAQINPDVQPAGLDPKPIQIGEYITFTADNGMEVFLIRKEGYPKFRFSIQFDVPLLGEEQQPEIRRITSDIFKNGNLKYSEKEISDIAELYAATVNGSITSMVCAGMKRDFSKLIPILSAYVENPKINGDTLNVLIAEAVKELKLKEQRSKLSKKREGVAILRDSLAFTKDENPEPRAATIVGYQGVTVSSVKTYFKKYINPKNSFCMITGDFTKEEANALINKNFKNWKGGEKFVSRFETKFKTTIPTQRKIYVVDKPGAVQSKIDVLWPLVDGFPYADNEPVLMIMNQIYGAGYNSNLNRNIRGDKALSYGANNFLIINITGGSCNSHTLVRTSQTAYALENIFFEMLRIRNDRVTKQDMDMAINGMLGDYARSMSQLNSPAIIGFGMVKAKFNLPDDYLKTYPIKLAKISADDVRNAAQKYIKPYECVVIIEGNLGELRGSFEKFGPVEYYTSEGVRIK